MASPPPDPSWEGANANGSGTGDSQGLDVSTSGPPPTIDIRITPPPPPEEQQQDVEQGATAAPMPAPAVTAAAAVGADATRSPAANSGAGAGAAHAGASVAMPQSATSAAAPSSPPAAAPPAQEPVARISFFTYYFRHADGLDVLMVFLGILGGIVSGALIPFFQWLFGRMLDSLNTGADIVEAVSAVAIQFAYMAALAFVVGHLQVWAWSVYGERQVARIRGLYVQALLRQDIGWYDRQTRGQMATIATELTAALQDGMGRKNGDVIEYGAQFFGGFVIAFIQSWRITLVLIAALPAIVIATAVMASLAGRAKKKESLAYAAAGAKAYETLASIRTVQALRLQDKVKAAYDRLLREAEKMGYSKAKDNAVGVGLLGACSA